MTVYATLHCEAPTLTEIQPKLKHTKVISHKWALSKPSEREGSTAGGSTRFSTYMTNPHWRLVLREESKVRIRLLTYKEVACNLRVFKGSKRVSLIHPELQVANSGDYRQGFCYAQIDRLSPGTYMIVPSTYYPQQEAPIKVSIYYIVVYFLLPLFGVVDWRTSLMGGARSCTWNARRSSKSNASQQRAMGLSDMC